MSGIEPYPGTGAYSPSKAALIMLVRVLALEWAADGVRVNAVSPGLFRTGMTAPIYADPQGTAAREALVSMHRIGDPEHDCAGVVAFLLSRDAGYMTGQNILVDGGLLGSTQRHIAGRPKPGGGRDALSSTGSRPGKTLSQCRALESSDDPRSFPAGGERDTRQDGRHRRVWRTPVLSRSRRPL